MIKNKRIVNRSFLDTFHNMNCLACNRRGCDPAHIKSRGSGGDDVYENVMPLCRIHHTEQGAIGWFRMADKHFKVALDLQAKGWTFNAFNQLIRKCAVEIVEINLKSDLNET